MAGITKANVNKGYCKIRGDYSPQHNIMVESEKHERMANKKSWKNFCHMV